MRYIREIIVHCTATKPSAKVTVESIDRYHRQIGWNGIGYHYVVYTDGTVHQGRAEEQIGAHCRGHNANSIGVAYVGGLDEDGKPKDTRTAPQRIALKELIAQLKQRYRGAVVHSHRDYANKACPCFDATEEYKDL